MIQLVSLLPVILPLFVGCHDSLATLDSVIQSRPYASSLMSPTKVDKFGVKVPTDRPVPVSLFKTPKGILDSEADENGVAWFEVKEGTYEVRVYYGDVLLRVKDVPVRRGYIYNLKDELDALHRSK